MNNLSYIVKKGDTLSAIANKLGVADKLGVAAESLIALNPGLNPNVIRVGQRLIIPHVGPVWLTIAAAEIGVKETAGEKHTARILEYHKCTSYRAQTDEIPWCSAFANWVMEHAGIKGTNSAAARSWLEWENGKQLDAPLRGAIVVMSRGNDPKSGHVGFFICEDSNRPGRITVLGGNQSNAVTYASFPAHSVLGYLWPKEKI